jgi:hypothetical protein
MSPSNLIDVIVRIVEVESPVHVDDVIRRVTQAAGLQRAGARIQDVLNRAVDMAARGKKLQRKKGFLWRQERHAVVVRDRSELPAQDKKLDRVAPEEIACALLASVRRNFSISDDDAVAECANDLGFQRVTASMHKRICRVINALVSKSIVTRDRELLSIAESPSQTRRPPESHN